MLAGTTPTLYLITRSPVVGEAFIETPEAPVWYSPPATLHPDDPDALPSHSVDESATARLTAIRDRAAANNAVNNNAAAAYNTWTSAGSTSCRVYSSGDESTSARLWGTASQSADDRADAIEAAHISSSMPTRDYRSAVEEAMRQMLVRGTPRFTGTEEGNDPAA